MTENGWQSTEAGQALQARLNDERTVNALNRLLDRIDSLEESVTTLTTTVEQAPMFVSMVTDTVDETVRRSAESGVFLDERLQTGLALLERLTEPKTAEKLNNLLDLADQAPDFSAMVGDMMDETYRRAAMNGVDIESRLHNALAVAEKLTAPETTAKLSQLLELTDQAPYFVGMVGDMADETVRSAAANGVDIEARLKAGLEIAEKLTAPEMVANLNQLLELSQQAPHFTAMIGDMVDETYRQAATNGVDIEARLQAGLQMAEKLTAPAMMANLDHALALADQAPHFAAMVGDMVDDTVRQMSAGGIDVQERMQVGLMAAERLTAPEMGDALSALTDPQLIGMLTMTGNALKESIAMPQKKVGLFGLLREMNDPDIQRGMNLLLNFGRAFGRKLS